MNKKAEKKNEQYPIELPGRDSTVKRSPIIDVTENEIYPMNFHSRHYADNTLGEDISEVVATDIEPTSAEQTFHGI